MAWGGCCCWISSWEHPYVTRDLLWVTFCGLPLHTSAFWVVVVVKAHSGALPGTVQPLSGPSQERATSVTTQLAGDLIILTLVARVFGADAIALLRRLAAAGVRAGVSEMTRHEREGGR